MEKFLIYFLAGLLSFLPVRYRRRWEVDRSVEMRGAAIAAGIAQFVLCTAVYIVLFIMRITEYMGEAGMLVLSSQRGDMDPMQVRLATGTLGLINFALQPFHMFLAYLIVEGAVRSFAAMAASEVLPTFPLYLVSAIHDRIDDARHKRELGPAITDVIQGPQDKTYDIHVLSCRPKPEWNSYITIRFRDEYYVVAGEERGPKPRPFVYRLRKNPTGRLVVVIREYCLDDPVKKPPYSGL